MGSTGTGASGWVVLLGSGCTAAFCPSAGDAFHVLIQHVQAPAQALRAASRSAGTLPLLDVPDAPPPPPCCSTRRRSSHAPACSLRVTHSTCCYTAHAPLSRDNTQDALHEALGDPCFTALLPGGPVSVPLHLANPSRCAALLKQNERAPEIKLFMHAPLPMGHGYASRYQC